MATARQRRAKLKRLKNGDGTPSDELLEGLSPKQAAGMTEGLDAAQYAERFPDPPAVDNISHLKGGVRYLPGTRVPIPTFVAEDDPTTIWTDGTDRLLRGENRTFPQEILSAMQAGHVCLRCIEPLLDPFPLACPLCGYAVKERQIIDFAMEFEGPKWLGPTKAAQEYLSELEERAEKKSFDEKLAAGASKMKGLIRRG